LGLSQQEPKGDKMKKKILIAPLNRGCKLKSEEKKRKARGTNTNYEYS